MRNFISINLDNSQNRIEISDAVWHYTVSNTSVSFNQYKNFEEISFKDYHCLTIRLSKEHIVYIDVRLFGCLINLFIIGPWRKEYNQLLQLTDIAFIFPITDRKIMHERYPNIEYKSFVEWMDIVVEFRLNELKKLKEKENE